MSNYKPTGPDAMYERELTFTPDVNDVDAAIYEAREVFQPRNSRERELTEQAMILAYEVERLRDVARSAGLDPYPPSRHRL